MLATSGFVKRRTQPGLHTQPFPFDVRRGQGEMGVQLALISPPDLACCIWGFDDGWLLRLFASSLGRCCWLCRSAELEDIFRHCGLMVTDFSAELARGLLGGYINPPLRAFFVSGRVCSTLTVKSPLRHRTCRWMSLVSSWVCCRALIFAGLHGNIKWRHFKLSNLPWQFRN